MQRMELEEVDMFKESTVSTETLKQYELHTKNYLDHNPPVVAADNGEEITDFILRYLTAMKKRKYSYSYRSISKAAIRRYYKSQPRKKRPDIDWVEINGIMGEKTEVHPVGPTHEQLRKLVDLLSPKLRAAVLTAASTGMRREALCSMKLEDMTYIEEYKLYKFRAYKGTPHEHVTFCSNESAEAINTYLAQEKPKIYLFPGEPNKGRKTKAKRKEYMSPVGLSAKLRDFMIKAELGTKTKGKTNVRDKIASVHSLKHFTSTQMSRANVDFVKKCIMLDQTGKLGVNQRYTHLMDDDLLKEYVKAIPFLTVYEKFQPVVITDSEKDEQIKSLQAQLLQFGEIAERQKTRVLEYDKEMQELRATVKELTDIVKNRPPVVHEAAES